MSTWPLNFIAPGTFLSWALVGGGVRVGALVTNWPLKIGEVPLHPSRVRHQHVDVGEHGAIQPLHHVAGIGAGDEIGRVDVPTAEYLQIDDRSLNRKDRVERLHASAAAQPIRQHDQPRRQRRQADDARDHPRPDVVAREPSRDDQDQLGQRNPMLVALLPEPARGDGLLAGHGKHDLLRSVGHS